MGSGRWLTCSRVARAGVPLGRREWELEQQVKGTEARLAMAQGEQERLEKEVEALRAKLSAMEQGAAVSK